jgi:hypothetical protein
MRKVIYGCVATAVVTAAGAYLLVDQAVRHPESLVGRWASAASELSVVLNPFALLKQVTPQASHAPLGCEQAPCRQNVEAQAPVCKPDKPEAGADAAPADEPTAEAREVIKVEEMAEGTTAGQTTAQEEAPEACEDNAHDTVSDETCEPLPVGEEAAEESESAESPANTGEAWPHMPRADEEEDSNTWEQDVRNLISGILQGGGICNDSTQADDEPCDQGAQPGQKCECDHGCPYSVCPPTSSRTSPATDATTESAPACADQPAKKKHKVKRFPLNTPSEADTLNQGPAGLDTLEYRPSDGDAHAFDDLLF